MSGGLEVTGLRVERDAGVLLNIAALSVAVGDVAVVTGPTDSGKTVLAAVLSGRLDATAGTVLVDGQRLSGTASARRRLGLAATVAGGGRIMGCTVLEALQLSGRARAARALDLFALLGLRRAVRAELLSGGEQQLLQVACAWCAATPVLVLDAPTTGLAADAAAAVAKLALDASASGTAVLWLDQPGGSPPAGTTWRLERGVLSPARAAG